VLVFWFTCSGACLSLARLSARTPYGLLLGIARQDQNEIVIAT